MKFIAECHDEAQCVDLAIFPITADSAKQIIEARKKLLELQKSESFSNLIDLVFHVDKVAQFFEMGQLGDEGIAETTDPEMLPDLLTMEQRKELLDNSIVAVADDLKLHDEDNPPPGEDSVFRWTDYDMLVIEAEGFFFRSHSGDYTMETKEIGYDILSRVL